MIVRYPSLFTLAIAHGFYEDGTSRDFDFVLPADTATLLRRGRLVARTLDGTLHVLFQAGADGTPVASIDGQTLRIGLRLQNPSFFNFTSSPGSPGTAIARYRNATDPATLDAAEAVTRQGRLLSHALGSAVRPLTVTLTNAQGIEVATDTLASGDDRTTVSFDLSGQPGGAFSVQEGSGPTTTYYVDAELAAAPALAVVEIAVDGDFYTTAPAFEVAFAAAEDTLKYYVVVRDHSEAEIATLSVSDAGFEEQSRDEVTFARVDALGSDDLSESLLTGDDEDVTAVLFKSDTPVARRQEGLKRIQLSRNGDVLIGSLPQPGGRAGADAIVHVKKS